MSNAVWRPERNLPENGGASVNFTRDLAALRRTAGMTAEQLAARSHRNVLETDPTGPYERIRLLGSGGMGEVWEAVDTRNGRHVALKLLPPDSLTDPQLAERFRRECEFVATIENQHVLPVYEAEVNGRPYIAMRLINGTNLASEIETGPLSPERAVAIVEQVAAALAAAHHRGLRHRDVKPSNILLQPGAQRGTDHAWLFDWGIAQQIDISGAPVTRNGRIIGTPAYMAPERLQNNNSDERADVYSLAVVLYECLTGRRPFESENEWHLLLAQVNQQPPDLPAHLPAMLRPVVAKGLAKRPDDRYQSAPELAAAAREALGVPQPAPPTLDEPRRQPGPSVLTRPPDRETARGAHWPTVGACAGLLVGPVLLGVGLIDMAMLWWIVPTLAVAGTLVGWGARPQPQEPPAPRPTDLTRDTSPGGIPPLRD